MDAMNEPVRSAWLDIRDAATGLRRKLHEWPELGYQEVETTRSLHQFLLAHGLQCETFGDLTGVVAFIDNKKPVTVALRVDIDALPLTENTGCAFSSKNNGVMHACGHDMHASIGASVAALLQRLHDHLPVNVKILFQPAEECSPRGGAREMKDLGVLQNPDVSLLFGFHIWPEYALGHVGVRPGPVMASSDKFKITVNGVSAHAAQPHKGVDAILMASELLTAIYTFLPRRVNVFNNHVLTLGEISSRGRYNVISDHVEMAGTLRTLDEETRKTIHAWLHETVQALPAVHGGIGTLDFDQGYDVVVNDPDLSALFARHAATVLGAGAVHSMDPPSLIAEDFSTLSHGLPALYFHLGCGCQHPLHSNQFLANEEAMAIGVELLGTFFVSKAFADFIKGM